MWTSISDFSFSHSICSRHLKIRVSSSSQHWARTGRKEQRDMYKITLRTLLAYFHSETRVISQTQRNIVYMTCAWKSKFWNNSLTHSLLLKSMSFQDQYTILFFITSLSTNTEAWVVNMLLGRVKGPEDETLVHWVILDIGNTYT